MLVCVCIHVFIKKGRPPLTLRVASVIFDIDKYGIDSQKSLQKKRCKNCLKAKSD